MEIKDVYDVLVVLIENVFNDNAEKFSLIEAVKALQAGQAVMVTVQEPPLQRV